MTDSELRWPIRLGCAVGGIVAAPGACLVLWQLYGYARTGGWQSVSLVDGLAWYGNQWAQAPSDWIGVHRFLAHIPASLALGVAGLILGFFGFGLGVLVVDEYGPVSTRPHARLVLGAGGKGQIPSSGQTQPIHV
jgi:hypothetical protein